MGNPVNGKSTKLLIILILACIIALPIISPLQTVVAQSQDQTQYYTRNFSWDYDGHHWTWNLSVPVSLYAAYKSVPDSVRVQIGPESFGYFTTTQDSYIQALAQKLNQTANQAGYGSYDEVNFILAFVQNIPYATDNVSTGYQSYPRFPVETLVDDIGDCKSHSLLFGTLTLALGFGTIYINPPDHLAVGVLGNNLTGQSFPYDGGTYYYCETTGIGYKIGQLPDQFSGQTCRVYSIDTGLQYFPNLQGITSFDPNPTISTATPQPTGTTTAEPDQTASPSVAGPTIQPDLPMLSLNMIADAPYFFIIIVVVVVICIVFAVRSVRAPKEPIITQAISIGPSNDQTAESNMEPDKFCIFCGSSNKSFAVYCEKCGKKIA